MTDSYPILRSLDPHHARIGYVGALASVARRGLDRVEALTARFHDLLFERIYPDDPRFDRLLSRVASWRMDELMKRMTRPPEDDPSSILSRPEDRTGWLYLHELWLYDQCMPSSLGALSGDQLHRTLDLARWTGILLPTLELSESGYLLQHFLLDLPTSELEPANLLNASARPSLPVLYLRTLIGAESLFAFLVEEFVQRTGEHRPLTTRGPNGLLRGAVDRMLRKIGEPHDPEDILALRDLMEFQTAIEQRLSTEENYLRPRLEILVDLGLVGRKGGSSTKRSDFMWVVTPATRRLDDEWRSLAEGTGSTEDYLDKRFFGSAARIYDKACAPVDSEEETLLWFAKAFQDIGRDFGFTPGRTLALRACLMAWESGRILEISDAFDVVYRAARSKWGKFLHFSGGSRFDREFLIRIDQEVVADFESAQAKKGSGSV